MFDDLFTVYSSLDPPPIQRVTSEPYLREDNFEPYKSNISAITPSINFSPSDPFSVQVDEPQFIRFNRPQITLNEDSSEKPQSKPQKFTGRKGQAEFERAFAQAASENPELMRHKDFFIKLCKHEGGFNPGIQNSAGAPYYGYFGFGQAALKQTSNYTMDQFRKDPVEQIRAAGKLYNQHIQAAKRLGFYDRAKQMGYSDDAIVAGAWLGGAGGVKNFIMNNRDASDSHWYGGKGGTSISKRMKAFM